MKRILLSVAVSSLFAVGCTQDTVAPTADNGLGPQFAAGGVVHRATAGSHDLVPPGVDANYSLVAIEHADGRITGQFTDRFAQGGGFHARVTCLSVLGNTAWVGGIITTPEELEGEPVVTAVQDNGTSANEPPDMITFSFIGAPDQLCLTRPPVPFFPIQGGEVKVE
jgi:hypothetical protein